MNELAPLGAALRAYRQTYPTEGVVVSRFESLLAEGIHAFGRNRLAGHFTASAWVLDPDRRKVLLVLHRKLGKWLQPGGHADGNTSLVDVARTEVLEETDVSTEAPALAGTWQAAPILDLDIHTIPARGSVPEHEHYDVRYLLLARTARPPRGNEENLEARWVPLDSLEEFSRESSILRMREKAIGPAG